MPQMRQVDGKKFQESVMNKKKTKVVYFANGNDACKKIFSKTEALNKHHPRLFLKVRVDKSKALATKCGVSKAPFFQLYIDGNKVGETKGDDLDAVKALIAQAEEHKKAKPEAPDAEEEAEEAEAEAAPEVAEEEDGNDD